jgi:CII-binding regulator of phage lambda lysogenization HflD
MNNNLEKEKSMEDTILDEIIKDLSDNYNQTDKEILKSILEEIIVDALSISNRKKTDENISYLKSDIKKAVKSIYLQRGKEDVTQDSESGLSNVYNDVVSELSLNIIKKGKRLIR